MEYGIGHLFFRVFSQNPWSFSAGVCGTELLGDIPFGDG